jgi:hypothetical protein
LCCIQPGCEKSVGNNTTLPLNEREPGFPG